MRITDVLLVDDNPADADLTSEVLASHGRPCRVHAVSSGVEAVAFLRRQGKYANEIIPDFVILGFESSGQRRPGRARRGQS